MNARQFLALRYGSVLLAVVGMVLWALWSWAHAIRAAEDEGLARARLMAIYVDRLVQTQVVLSRAAFGEASAHPVDYVDDPAFRTFLTDIQSAQEGSRGVAIYAANGKIRVASRDYPADIRLPLAAPAPAGRTAAPVILERVRTPEPERDLLVVALPIGPDAFFAAALDPSTVQDFFHGIASAREDAASLLRADGMLLLRRDRKGPVLLGPQMPAVQQISRADSGSYRAKATTDGIDRLYAFTRVGNLGLFVNYGQPMASIRQAWFLEGLPVWLFIGSLGLFSFLSAGRIQRLMASNLAAQRMREQLIATERLAEQRGQLMQELNHRVKNNLATMSSLISLQLRRTGTVDGEDLRMRLEAIVEVHALLLGSGDDQQVDLGQLVDRLSRSAAIVPPERSIEVERDLARGLIAGSDTAVPLALIVAELLTNAVKHAFAPGDGARIALRLAREGDGAVLTLADNGAGAPEASARRSGLNIVEALVRQIEGSLTRTTAGGTAYRLSFPLPPPTRLVLPPRP